MILFTLGGVLVAFSHTGVDTLLLSYFPFSGLKKWKYLSENGSFCQLLFGLWFVQKTFLPAYTSKNCAVGYTLWFGGGR